MSRTARFLLVVLMHGTAALCLAQPAAPADTARPRFAIGSSHTALGYMKLSFPELDARFDAAGLPRAASGAGALGLGVDIRPGRLLVGGGYQSLFTPNQSDASYRTRMTGGIALLDLGVDLVRSRRLSVYPIVGAGVLHLSLNVHERGDIAFDDGLATPAREIDLSNTSLLFQTGLLVEHRIAMRGAEYAVSLRFGVTGAVGNGAWRSAEDQVQGGPSGVRSTYVRFGFSRPLSRRRDAALPLAGMLGQAVVR